MIRILCTLTFVLTAGAIVVGCADDPYPGRQRPTYSYENVDRGPQQSGQQYRFDERPSASDYSDSRSQAWRY